MNKKCRILAETNDMGQLSVAIEGNARVITAMLCSLIKRTAETTGVDPANYCARLLKLIVMAEAKEEEDV